MSEKGMEQEIEKEVEKETGNEAEPETKKKPKEEAASADTERKPTKYDLKMQRRAEEKRKEARDAKIGTAVGIVIVALLVALIASFPIRSYLSVHGTKFTVGDHRVTQVEYDYYYNTIKNNYLNTYGAMMTYYYGIDLSGDLGTVYYDDYLTFDEYFQKEVVRQIQENEALLAEAAKDGFTYDVTADYQEYLETAREAMVENSLTERQFYAQSYGDYATEKRIESLIRDAIFLEKYYAQKVKEFYPSDEEIETYYVENASDYDLVDYRMTSVAAELPTVPTALADEGAQVAEDGSYTPSEAETEAALVEAESLAQEAEKTVAEDGELYTGMTYSGSQYALREWLFADGRTAGDTTYELYDYTNTYYVGAFEARYRDETETRDLRLIQTDEDNGADILAEFAAGDGSEESFIALVEKYSDDTTDGGLYEGQDGSSLDAEMYDWLFATERARGDVWSYYDEDNAQTYVLYYLGTDKPEYYFDIRTTLQSEMVESYLEELTAQYPVLDTKGSLTYLEAEAQREADEADAEG